MPIMAPMDAIVLSSVTVPENVTVLVVRRIGRRRMATHKASPIVCE